MDKILVSNTEHAPQTVFALGRHESFVEYSEHERPDIFSQFPAPVAILTGRDKVFTFANPAFVEMLGHDPMGHSVNEVFGDKDDSFHLSMLDSINSSGRPYKVQERQISRPGLPTIYVNISFHPFKDSLGSELGTLVFCQDVTEQVEVKAAIRESETYFRSLARDFTSNHLDGETLG